MLHTRDPIARTAYRISHITRFIPIRHICYIYTQGPFPNVSWRWQKKKTVWDTLDSDSDYQDSGGRGVGRRGRGVRVED